MINALAQSGYKTFDEISRQVIKEAQQDGIEQLFLTEPLLFSQKLLEGRIAQYNAAAEINDAFVIYDRGIPDIPAYMDYAGQKYTSVFTEACEKYVYDRVFALSPWEAIHEVDNERYEDFETATRLHDFLIKTYHHYGYTPIEIPQCSIKKRVDFIEKHLKR